MYKIVTSSSRVSYVIQLHIILNHLKSCAILAISLRRSLSLRRTAAHN